MIFQSQKELEQQMVGKGCELCRLGKRHDHKHDNIMYLSPCHPESGLRAEYQQGGIVLSCFTCGRAVAALAIAQSLAEIMKH